MGTLIVSNMVSLDGCVTGPRNNVMVLPMDASFDAYNAERLRAADTLLLGRKTFEGFKSFWPSVADDPDPRWTSAHREISRLDNEIDKVVVSDTLAPAETAPWSNTRIASRGDAHEQIDALKQRSEGEILVFGSHTLWSDLLAHGLVDELHLMVGPVVVGAGRRAFDEAVGPSLRLIGAPRTWEGSGNVLLRYEATGRSRQAESTSAAGAVAG